MAKYGNTEYMQLTRSIVNEYDNLSNGAKWLFVVLNELEHRFTTGREGGQDFFFRTNAALAKDARVSETTLKRQKAELKKSGLVQIWQMHWTDPKTGKKSEEKVTAYRILR